MKPQQISKIRVETSLACYRSIWAVCRHFTLTLPSNPLCPGVPVPPSLTEFHSRDTPTVPLDDYVDEVWSSSKYSRASLPIAITLMARYWVVTGLPPCEKSCHRLAAIALLVAGKTHQERPLKNSAFASICGMPLEEVNLLEVCFLTAIRFRCYTSATDVSGAMLPLMRNDTADVCEHLGDEKSPAAFAGAVLSAWQRAAGTTVAVAADQLSSHVCAVSADDCTFERSEVEGGDMSRFSQYSSFGCTTAANSPLALDLNLPASNAAAPWLTLLPSASAVE